MNIIGVDMSTLPDQTVEIPIGIEPKKKSKYKVIQNILIKLFGYKTICKTCTAKVLTTKAEDFPKGLGDITISFGQEDSHGSLCEKQ